MVIQNKDEKFSIDGDGFLEKTDFEQIIVKRYYLKDFELLSKINRYMYSVYHEIVCDSEDELGCFFLGFYGKIHKTLQVAILIAARGLEESTKALIRSILDKLMIMQAISKDSTKYQKWRQQSDFQMKMLVIAINNGEPGLAQFKDKLPEGKDLPEGKRVSQKQWAKWADMVEDYNIVYRKFSGDVHASMNSFKDDFVYKNGVAKEFIIAPVEADMKKIVITLARYALQTIKIAIKYFKVNDGEYKNLEDAVESMAD